MGPWPQTRDHFIPFRLFLELMRHAPAVLALDRLNMAQAVAHGAGRAFGGSDKVRDLTDGELRDAFPERAR